MTEKTTVIFRKFKDKGDVIALFPYEVWNKNGTVSSYMHIGQHSGADYDGLLSVTTLAKPEEYKDLKEELEGLGYKLVVNKKRCAYMHRLMRI